MKEEYSLSVRRNGSWKWVNIIKIYYMRVKVSKKISRKYVIRSDFPTPPHYIQCFCGVHVTVYLLSMQNQGLKRLNNLLFETRTR